MAADWETESLDFDHIHRRVETIADIVRAERPATVLELGCSTGNLRSLLRGVDYWGCDISSVAVERHNDRQVVVADLNEGIPFDGPFDVIVGSGILEYIDDLPALFAQARSRLNPGGSVVLSYVNTDHWMRRRSRRKGAGQQGREDWRPLLSPSDLTGELRRAGFGQPKVRGHRPTLPKVDLPQWVGVLPGKSLVSKHLIYWAKASDPPTDE